MPCRDYFTDNMPLRSSSEAHILKQRADLLARVACRALTALETFDPELNSVKDKELRKFWADHKSADNKRKLAEEKEKAAKAEKDKLRKAALAKLTPEEIEAFGLNKKATKRKPESNWY